MKGTVSLRSVGDVELRTFPVSEVVLWRPIKHLVLTDLMQLGLITRSVIWMHFYRTMLAQSAVMR